MANLSVKACGMITAVGFNASASLAAIRAGIRGVDETNLWDAESGDYLAAGRVLLPHWWIGLGKLAELVAPAIHECLSAAKPVTAEEIPIFLGLAAPGRPHRWENLDEEILDEIQHRLGFNLHPESRVIPRGRVAGAVGLQLAAALIEHHKLQYCIVAGVDSFVRQDVVEYYLEKRRILTPMNSNGFSAGEAGSAILMTTSESSSEGELRILGVGMARETATIESEEPLRGNGLTQAIGKAFKEAGLTIQEMQYRITDLNGEHYKFKEMTLAMIRYERKTKPNLFDLWHPIEYIGEVGAAIGP
ncbi:MAG: hypothetical protein JRD04_12650, partial [Deltaproteobacteria bacterium]|nr:hypothetical protein [Deltaproteobacteria bacterium]